MQFIRRDGVDYLIDLNPRLYGSLALPMAAGANHVALWTSLVLGHPLPHRAGIRYWSDEHEPRALARQALSDRRAALAAALPRQGTAHSILSLRDPAPAVASAAKAAARVSSAGVWLRRAVAGAASGPRGRMDR